MYVQAPALLPSADKELRRYAWSRRDGAQATRPGLGTCSPIHAAAVMLELCAVLKGGRLLWLLRNQVKPEKSSK